jgi:hypothetical protein
LRERVVRTDLQQAVVTDEVTGFLSLTLVPASGLAEGAFRKPPPRAVRIGVPELGDLQFLSFWVAIGAGFFVDEGLDVALVFSPTPDQAPQLVSALAANSVSKKAVVR